MPNILEQLQERAKELRALYRVHEAIRREGATEAEVCREVARILPDGWQYPSVAWGRVVFEGRVYEPPGAVETPWAQRADVVVRGERVGSVEVYYTRQVPAADEGPFLREERKLLEAVADRLARFAERLRAGGGAAGSVGAGGGDLTEEREWWLIVEFLRSTDQHLLVRLARRLLNHLCWSGIAEAQDLLQRFAADTVPANQPDGGVEDNIPKRRKTLAELIDLTEATFEIAAAHLGEGEIVACIEDWIKDDRSGFLVEALENQCTSLSDIGEALERHHQLALGDGELSRAVQIGLRVSLARRFFTDDLDFLNTAKNYIAIGDFYELIHHIISPPASHGKLGGKSSGMLLASQILRKSGDDLLSGIQVPKTWYIASDGLQSFAEHNQLEDVYNRKYLEIEQVRREYPHIVQVFKNSSFAPDILAGLSRALDDLEGRPLIVRSSSLLEDRMGSAFSGKYKSLFLANVGTKAERLNELTDAIAEVYASLFGPDPIEYRAERNLLDLHEEMGVMIQEVVGSRVGPYFMPAFAGVAFSHNEFRWSPRIRREDGLVRLVPGLGTRAVDRVSDDYPVLVAPGQSGLRVNVTTDEILRYQPRRADVINLETRRFETVDLSDLFRAHGADYPGLPLVASVLDADRMIRPLGYGDDPARANLVATFEGLIGGTPFMPRMREILAVLREQMGVPVDIEFACDGTDLYLLQCRPQSFSIDSTAAAIPRDVPAGHLLFDANRYVSNGRVPDISHIVYVDPAGYDRLARLEDLKDVGRAVGRLNKLLPRRQFVLMGPGRWGSRGDIKLGVSVTYSDINNAAVLVEIAARRGNSVPDLSFGTHFFQDLVEAGIRYLPLFPGEEGQALNDAFIREAHNALPDLLPEYRHLAHVVHVVDVAHATGGLALRVLMNADEERAVGIFAPPAFAQGPVAIERRVAERPPVTDDHWRWRLRMAERIAEQVDAARFGVRGMYVFGSTKNATAGPESDINLVVHVEDGAAGRDALEAWLEGWSLCLSEMNYVRTGVRTTKLLDVHVVTDTDVARQAGAAAKINAVRDPARPLRVGAPS